MPGYEVLAEIGRGGMGIVYKARDIRLNRLVAIKMIMAGDFASEHHLVRFLVEGETLARLHHPNIVKVYEAGQHEGRPYLALEHVEGITLSDRLKQGPLPPRTAAVLVERLALAMHYAHQEGIVHRDLKPANILLKRLQEDEDAPSLASSSLPFHPMITDFGLARGLNLDVSLTESGVVLGTPSYMAPEQAQNSKRLGPTVDVYGLGAIFYEMLAGHPPFRADGPMQTIHAVI
ncbi:serine/threonine-protein kinase, partial [Singulisphaera rosea]